MVPRFATLGRIPKGGIRAVASASPSIRPIMITLAPRVVAINSGKRLWITYQRHCNLI
jgi:hypothetical protein